MKLPSISLKTLTDKWVLIGLAAGAGVYFIMKPHRGYASPPMMSADRRIMGGNLHTYFPHYDEPGLYEVPGAQGDFSHMRFSGAGELQRRLTIV